MIISYIKSFVKLFLKVFYYYKLVPLIPTFTQHPNDPSIPDPKFKIGDKVRVNALGLASLDCIIPYIGCNDKIIKIKSMPYESTDKSKIMSSFIF